MSYTNKDDFDCRNYINIGDKIRFRSMKACTFVEMVSRDTFLEPCEAFVKAVYRDFVVVDLGKVTDCVSRWNIIKVNDVPLGNRAGCFKALKNRGVA